MRREHQPNPAREAARRARLLAFGLGHATKRRLWACPALLIVAIPRVTPRSAEIPSQHLQQRGLLHIETKDFLVYPPV